MSVNVMKLDGFLGRVVVREKKRAALGDAARKRRKNVSDRLAGKETSLEETPIACVRSRTFVEYFTGRSKANPRISCLPDIRAGSDPRNIHSRRVLLFAGEPRAA